MTISLSSATAFALLLFCATLVPAVVNVPIEPREDLYQFAESSLKSDLGGSQPQKAQIKQRYQQWIAYEWTIWWRNLALLGASILAAALTLAQIRLGLWLTLAACVYVLYIAAPPLIQLSIPNGFFNLSSTVLFSGMQYHGTFDGLILFWHIVVAPFAYALLAIAVVVSFFKGHRGGGKHESNL